jgi:hypothetical protein
MMKKTMQMLFQGCLVTSAMCNFGTVSAANLPGEFIGVWTPNLSSKCTSTDWKGVAASNNTDLVSVSKDAIEFYESGCRILNSFGRKANDTETGKAYETEVELSCGGYGMIWRTRELWHVRDMNQRKLLVTVRLKTYYTRDDFGKLMKMSDGDEKVEVYVECK